MSESIQILIEADDRASGKLKAVGANVDNLGRRVKETGGRLKAGTELAGTFASAFGGSVFGTFASEMAQVTERVSAFSEVAKGGKAGALAFKAALAGAVAITAFKIGEAIGNWAFETQRWKDELKAAATEAERLQGIMDKRQQKAFAEAREDISLVRDPGDREAATLARMEQLQKEAQGLETRLGLAEKEVTERRAANDAAWFKGNSSEELKMAEDSLARLKQNKQSLEEERAALGDTISERAKSIEARKAENALADRSQSFLDGLREEVALLKATTEERLKMEAAKNTTPEQRGEAEGLLKEREALREKAEAEKELAAQAEQARRAELAQAEKVQELQKKELAKLEEKRILLTQGAEAARAFALEQEGLSQMAAANIASQEAALEQKQATDKFAADKQPLQATESRLLTRGTGSDPQAKMAQDTAKIAQGSAEQVKALQELIKQQQRVIEAMKNQTKIEVVTVY